MDKIRNGMEASGVSDLLYWLNVSTFRLEKVVLASNNLHMVDMSEIANSTLLHFRDAVHDLEERLEEYEERS